MTTSFLLFLIAPLPYFHFISNDTHREVNEASTDSSETHILRITEETGVQG